MFVSLRMDFGAQFCTPVRVFASVEPQPASDRTLFYSAMQLGRGGQRPTAG